MISENIAGSILATQTQRQQWYKEFNTGCSLMVKIKFEKPIRRRKVKPLHAVLRQETSDARQEDKEHKAA